MTIAVHINDTGSADDPIKNFNYNCFTVLAGKYPREHFIFISDKPFNPGGITHSNITPVVLTPAIRNNLLLHFWYNFKLPRLLNKYNADLFVSKDPVCSLRTNVAQCIVLHDLSFLKKKGPLEKNESRYLKKYFTAFVTKAKRIIITNACIKHELIQKLPVAAGKVYASPYGVPEIFAPGDPATQDHTQQHITAGRAYFLFHITEATWPNIMTILKAFSSFKKWQKSNMQLVLFFSASQKDKQIKNFGTYKYRNEVKVINEEKNETLASITSAAYAAIYLPVSDRGEFAGITVLKSGTPLITSDNEFCKAIYHDAALYAAPDEKSVSEKMMLLYKDENLRNNLISRGKHVVAGYSWENTADILWPILLDSLE